MLAALTGVVFGGGVSEVFDPEVGLPSGVVRSATGVWIADRATGALTLSAS